MQSQVQTTYEVTLTVRVKASSKMEASRKIMTMVVTSATTVRDIKIQDFKVIEDDD